MLTVVGEVGCGHRFWQKKLSVKDLGTGNFEVVRKRTNAHRGKSGSICRRFALSLIRIVR
jgi:hypothetical protein